MEPYYRDDLATLYHGDARDILPKLAADVLITDPPYGVGLGVRKDTRGASVRAGRHGLAKQAYNEYDDTYENYVESVCPIIRTALGLVRRGAVFTGPHMQELPKAAAVGGVYCTVAGGRHSWGFKAFLPVLFYGTDPRLHHGARPNVIRSNATAEKNGHPCPKPLPWMRWLVDLASLPGETVLDTFAGSGTTLRAAKELGRPSIGIEMDERYCEIAARELSQDVLPMPV